jgi:hypothetical protein
MLVLTEHSIASDWVEGEVEAALERERREKRTVLFPIQLDQAVVETQIGWTSHIRQTRHIGDFRGWENHGAYQSAFARLLKGLKAVESTGGDPPPATGPETPHWVPAPAGRYSDRAAAAQSVGWLAGRHHPASAQT